MSNKVSVPLTKDALLKSYRKRLKDDVTSMMSNFTEIIKLCKIEEHAQITRPAQCEEDAFEMQVRAANMVSLSRHYNTPQRGESFFKQTYLGVAGLNLLAQISDTITPFGV